MPRCHQSWTERVGIGERSFYCWVSPPTGFFHDPHRRNCFKRLTPTLAKKQVRVQWCQVSSSSCRTMQDMVNMKYGPCLLISSQSTSNRNRRMHCLESFTHLRALFQCVLRCFRWAQAFGAQREGETERWEIRESQRSAMVGAMSSSSRYGDGSYMVEIHLDPDSRLKTIQKGLICFESSFHTCVSRDFNLTHENIICQVFWIILYVFAWK